MELLEAVSKAQHGDQNAFAWIFELFSDRIYRFISYKIQNKQDAEEVCQEIFIKAWNGLPSVRLENLNFSAWLYKIAANTVNDFFRKKYRTAQSVELSDAISNTLIDQKTESYAGNSEIIAKAFAQLPEQYRQVLELRFVHELTLDETAILLNKSNLAVRLSQHRGLKKLRSILEKYDL